MSGLNENKKKIIDFVLNNKEITNKQAVELIGRHQRG